MANGRLAHVSVPANSYATIYTNSSGSQASVTLAADGTETGKLSFRISQDANPANTLTTTLATETFVLNDDLVINADSLPSAPAGSGDILDRFQWPRTSSTRLTRPNNFQFLYNDATAYPALWGASSGSNGIAFNRSVWPVVPWEIKNSIGYIVFPTSDSTTVPADGFGNGTGIQNYTYKTSAIGTADNFQNRSDYYYRMMGARQGTGPDGSTFDYWSSLTLNASYSNRAVTYDPYYVECGAYVGNSSTTGETAVAVILAAGDNGYMDAKAFRMDATATTTTSTRSSDAVNYNAGFRNFKLSTTTNSRPYLRASGGVYVSDLCDNMSSAGSSFGMFVYAINGVGRSLDEIVQAVNSTSSSSTYRGGVKIMYTYTNGPSDLPGGQNNDVIGGKVLFLEYDEVEDVTYLCFRVRLKVASARSDQLRLWKIKRKDLVTSSTGSPTSFQELYDYTALPTGITDVSSEISLSFTNTAISEGTVTYRVQRAAKKLWVLTAFDEANGDTDIRVSTDLKTWKTYAAHYTPDDYYVPALDDSTVSIRHDSGSFFYIKDNFQNISTDGILENNQDMLHYIRSGLVLSNGDKIICQNTGSTAMAVQVFGYEG